MSLTIIVIQAIEVLFELPEGLEVNVAVVMAVSAQHGVCCAVHSVKLNTKQFLQSLLNVVVGLLEGHTWLWNTLAEGMHMHTCMHTQIQTLVDASMHTHTHTHTH